MSHLNTSDLLSTIATQLTAIIASLRTLLELTQTLTSTSSLDMTPVSCPSRPHATPASPLRSTTTFPPITWAPYDRPGEQATSPISCQNTPAWTLTPTTDKDDPLHLSVSPTLGPPTPPPLPPVHPGSSPSSPLPLALPPSPLLSPPGYAYPPPPSSPPPPLPPPSPSPSPSCSLVSSAPPRPLPSRPRKRRSAPSSPSPSPHPCYHSDTSWDDDWSAKDDDLLVSLKCNERLRPSWRYITSKMQRPESQIRARWAELLELQQLASS